MRPLAAFAVFVLLLGVAFIGAVSASQLPETSKNGLFVMMGLFMGASLLVTLAALLIRAVRYDDGNDD